MSTSTPKPADENGWAMTVREEFPVEAQASLGIRSLLIATATYEAMCAEIDRRRADWQRLQEGVPDLERGYDEAVAERDGLAGEVSSMRQSRNVAQDDLAVALAMVRKVSGERDRLAVELQDLRAKLVAWKHAREMRAGSFPPYHAYADVVDQLAAMIPVDGWGIALTDEPPK